MTTFLCVYHMVGFVIGDAFIAYGSFMDVTTEDVG